MTTKNPPWTRDELILALDLYVSRGPQSLSPSSKEVDALSQLLNSLPTAKRSAGGHTFRNPTGVYMKLQNFRSLDPAETASGLTHGAKLDKLVWENFHQKPEYLHQGVKAIRSAGSHPQLAMPTDEEQMFPEGRLLYRHHRYRERTSALVSAVKKQAQRKGRLIRLVCDFNFEKAYGELGHGFIECHHLVPVSDYPDTQPTSPRDLALVCANCHRMLHRRRPWLRLEELSQILADTCRAARAFLRPPKPLVTSSNLVVATND
jgi:5-methylcytosine-specific restriction protein A